MWKAACLKGFVSYTLVKKNRWTGVVWIIVMFLSVVWTQILTAPIHCRGSIAEQVMFWCSSPNLFWWRNKHLLLILDGLRLHNNRSNDDCTDTRIMSEVIRIKRNRIDLKRIQCRAVSLWIWFSLVLALIAGLTLSSTIWKKMLFFSHKCNSLFYIYL